MKSLPWLLLLGFVVAACGSNRESPAVLDLSKGPKTFQAVPERDPIVKVSGPSVVYVEQHNQKRIIVLAKRAGEVIVPVRAVDDGSGALTVGVATPGTEEAYLKKLPEDTQCPDICIDCLDVANACCM